MLNFVSLGTTSKLCLNESPYEETKGKSFVDLDVKIFQNYNDALETTDN